MEHLHRPPVRHLEECPLGFFCLHTDFGCLSATPTGNDYWILTLNCDACVLWNKTFQVLAEPI